MLKFLAITVSIMITKNNPMATMVTMMVFNMSLQTSMNAKTSYFMSSDLISFWITNMSIMLFYTLTLIKQKNMSFFKNSMTAMMLILMVTFNNWSFMMFYVMFEMAMIIIMVTIISWGYQPERTEAIMFMIIMTLLFSLPFMVALVLNKKKLNFWFMEMSLHLTTFMSFMLIFMVKMPIYFTHFWLPKAHVEAPVHGSMILAAILLKLGCYGMMRMMKTIVNFSNLKPLIVSTGVISMALLSATCLIQIDLKTLIAYSSIVHMSMVFTNIFIAKPKSIFSSILIIVGHGLCSAALFFMANTMYENSKSRSIILNKGILNMLPAMTFMWFLVCMNNAPMPPSINMMGELVSFKNLVSWSTQTYPIIVIVAMASSTYSIYLFCAPGHGNFSKMINSNSLKTSKHAILLTTLVSPLCLITAKPAMMMVM